MIANAFPPVYMGGESVHLYNLVEGLAERGHKIVVIYSRPAVNRTSSVTLYHVRPGVDAYCIWLQEGQGYDERCNAMLLAVARQVLAAGGTPDVVHCHSNRCMPALKRLAEKHAIPVVSTVHAIHIPMVYEVKRKKGATISAGEEKEYRRDVSRTSALCHYSGRIVAISGAMVGLIEKYYRADPAKVRLVYNGVNAKRLGMRSDDRETKLLKNELGLKGRIIVLLSGRMEPVKGVCRFAEAARDICRKDKSVSVILMGNGSADGWLRSYLGGVANVHFVNWMPWDRATLFYHLADIVVTPSLIEPFGLVAVEAMACRNCVIVSNADGLDEIVSDGINGLKVPLLTDTNGDRDISAQEIRQRLTWALEDESGRNELAESGVSRAGDFSHDRMAQETESVYRELLHGYVRPEAIHQSAERSHGI